MSKIFAKLKTFSFEQDVDLNSMGYKIDLLIRSDLKNWQGKEIFFNKKTPINLGNEAMSQSFQANKIRNRMITEINETAHEGPSFHFRNYHNY